MWSSEINLYSTYPTQESQPGKPSAELTEHLKMWGCVWTDQRRRSRFRSAESEWQGKCRQGKQQFWCQWYWRNCDPNSNFKLIPSLMRCWKCVGCVTALVHFSLKRFLWHVLCRSACDIQGHLDPTFRISPGSFSMRSDVRLRSKLLKWRLLLHLGQIPGLTCREPWRPSTESDNLDYTALHKCTDKNYTSIDPR